MKTNEKTFTFEGTKPKAWSGCWDRLTLWVDPGIELIQGRYSTVMEDGSPAIQEFVLNPYDRIEMRDAPAAFDRMLNGVGLLGIKGGESHAKEYRAALRKLARLLPKRDPDDDDDDD